MSAKLEKLEKLAAKGKGAKIIKFLNTKDFDVVKDAIAALGKCGGEDAINALTGLCQSTDKNTKIAAVKALANCGGTYSVTQISNDFIKEKDPELKQAMSETLDAIRKRLKAAE